MRKLSNVLMFIASVAVILTMAQSCMAHPDAWQENERADNWTEFVSNMQSATYYLVLVAGVALIGLLVLAALRDRNNRLNERNRYRDGMAPIMNFSMKVRGQKVKVVHDPNKTTGHTTIFSEHGIVNIGADSQLQAAVTMSLHGVQATQAKYPGDWAYEHSPFPVRTPGAGRTGLVGQPRAPQNFPHIVDDGNDQPALPAPVPTPMALLENSTAAEWHIGNSEKEHPAVFIPSLHHNIAVVGAQGTGKSSSMLPLLIMHALRARMHVILLDPKGLDFQEMRRHIEYVHTDEDAFPAQMAALELTATARMRTLGDHGKRNWAELMASGYQEPEIFVCIDEFGLMMQSAAKGDVERVARMYKVMRATGIHICAVDQDVQAWPLPALSGSKARVAFAIDPSTAGKMGMQKAQYVAPRGEFVYANNVHRIGDCAPHMRQLLATTPATRMAPLLTGRRIVEAQEAIKDAGRSVHGGVHGGVRNGVHRGSSPEVAPPTPRPVNTGTNGTRGTPTPAADPQLPNSVSSWYEWVLENYLDDHTDLLQTDERGRGMGINDLARTMAFILHGSEELSDNYKSTASQVAKRIRREAGLGADQTQTIPPPSI